MISRPLRALRALVATSALLLPLLTHSPALAAGTVSPAKSTLEDSGSGWKLMVTVKLGKKPAMAHQTFRFIFRQTALYETFLDDAKPGEQTRKIPRDKAVEPLIESLDVGFSDAKGDIWDATKFDFQIRRERGFEAGEYTVEVRDSDNHVVGRPFSLTLAGKNEVVDRRAMVFASNDKKKKKDGEDKGGGASDKPAEAKADTPADAAKGGSSPDASKGSAADTAASKGPDQAAAPPPELKQKPGGCGCEVPAGHAPLEGSVVAVVALGVALARRGGRTRNRA